MANEEQEHMATVKIEGGDDIIFNRRGKNTEITRGDNTVVLPKSSGMQTLQLLGLVEDFGKIETEEEE